VGPSRDKPHEGAGAFLPPRCLRLVWLLLTLRPPPGAAAAAPPPSEGTDPVGEVAPLLAASDPLTRTLAWQFLAAARGPPAPWADWLIQWLTGELDPGFPIDPHRNL